jgi:hypothetical protein
MVLAGVLFAGQQAVSDWLRGLLRTGDFVVMSMIALVKPAVRPAGLGNTSET